MSFHVCLSPSHSPSLYASFLAFLGFWPVHKLSHLHYEWQWGELTRLLVFETHACDHTWKKDLQQCALAKALSLFIRPFPSAMGLFFFIKRTIYSGDGRKGAGLGKGGTGLGSGWGWLLFSSFTSQVNPHYLGPWSLESTVFRTSAIEGVFISWLQDNQIIMSRGGDARFWHSACQLRATYEPKSREYKTQW